jgi:hypothetical protein
MRRIHRSVFLTAVLAAAGQASAQDILREAVGDRAAELTAMELKPFDQTLWSMLSEWTNGQALDTQATAGKVVLIATWSSWNPAATRSITTLQELKQEFGEKGLLVVGVHHPTGWEKAADALTKRHADFLAALDAGGKFREGIRSDQDPDFYLIDRAGQLRYADIRTESVTAAVKELIAEDAAAAGSLVSRMESEAAVRDAEFRRPQTIQSQVNLSTMPEVPFVAPGEAAYASTSWPERKTDEDNRGRDEDRGPRPMPVPAAGWVSEPPKAGGRAVVYYAWLLDDPRSVTLVREMESLQKQLGRDAVIVGVLSGVRSEDRDRGRDEENLNPEEVAGRLERFRVSHGISHPMVMDIGGAFFENERGGRNNEGGYPAAVVSSDSIARWEGTVFDDAFRAALNRVINVDPGIRARRAAEEAYIRAKGG